VTAPKGPNRSGPNRSGTDRRRKASNHGVSPDGTRLVLGQQAVREVVRVWGEQTREVWVQAGDSLRSHSLATYARDQGIEVRLVERSELDRISAGQFHQGAAAFAPPLVFTPWESLLVDPELLAVALDGVVDPQNFGAVIRSAVGIAQAPVIWAESSSAPLLPSTFRASAGAIEHARLCQVPSLHGALAEAAAAGVTVVGLTPDAAQALHEVPLRGPLILVIGSEEKGMGRSVRKACTSFARLHQSGAVQSLNASVAAGICLYAATISRLKTNS
jgi:23S rRNA (guanosine2251-2'-O)-methyltransferase